MSELTKVNTYLGSLHFSVCQFYLCKNNILFEKGGVQLKENEMNPSSTTYKLSNPTSVTHISHQATEMISPALMVVVGKMKDCVPLERT